MFVRWKRRPAGWRSYWRGHIRKKAVLVRSVRRDGKPRQEIIACLGTLIEGHERNTSYLVSFWRTADAALDRLDPSIRKQAREQLQAVVPRPTSAQIALQRERDERVRLKDERRLLRKAMGRSAPDC
jgi:hypothetical protein